MEYSSLWQRLNSFKSDGAIWIRMFECKLKFQLEGILKEKGENKKNLISSIETCYNGI